MSKRKRNSKNTINFERHFIDCSNANFNEISGEVSCKKVCCFTIKKQTPEEKEKIIQEETTQEKEIRLKQEEITTKKENELYRKTWKLYSTWAPKNYKNIKEEPTLPVWIIETTDMLNSAPYKPFTPDKSFLEKNSFAQTIKYRFHECRCKLQHCFLRNTFPTYHPKNGMMTSVVNYICIKSQCSNNRLFKGNYIKLRKTVGADYPMHSRNYRQIILYDEKDLDVFEKDGNNIPIVRHEHLGRIVICLNHFSTEFQIFFWKYGYMPKNALIRTLDKVKEPHPIRKAYPTGFSGHQVARKALLESEMLSETEILPLFPSTKAYDHKSNAKILQKCKKQKTDNPAITLFAPTAPRNIIFEPTPSTSRGLDVQLTPSTSTGQLARSDKDITIRSDLNFEDSENFFESETSDEFPDSEEFYQSAEELENNLSVLQGPATDPECELTVSEFEAWIILLKSRLKSNQNEVLIFPINKEMETAENSMYGFSIYQIRFSQITTYFFGKSKLLDLSNEENSEFANYVRNRVFQCFNKEAEKNGWPLISNYRLYQTTVEKGVSLAAASFAEFVTQKTNCDKKTVNPKGLFLNANLSIYKEEILSILSASKLHKNCTHLIREILAKACLTKTSVFEIED